VKSAAGQQRSFDPMAFPLIIVGASGLGREGYGWGLARIEADREWVFDGFLDANPRALDGYPVPAPILGDPLDHVPRADRVYLCAVGDPGLRQHLTQVLESRGARFVSVIDPRAVIGPGCHVDDGCLICPGAILSTNVRLGRHVIVNMNTTIGHDARVEDCCTLSCHVDLTGGVRLGTGVLVGSHASVLPQLTVGDRAVVGAGSIVVRSVPPDTTVFGVPARPVWNATLDGEGPS
jgi:sugar O-acyltransferase (sialic acid O-acetyltransferase NeuD family)